MIQIVIVHKCDIPPFCRVQPRVARRRSAAVFPMNDADAGVFGGISVQNRGTGIRRTVIDANNFEISKRLRQHAVQSRRQILFRIVNGNDNGHFGCGTIDRLF